MTTRTRPARKSRPKRQRRVIEPIAQNWTNDQALAVYDFCSALQELIWRRYQHALIDSMLQAQFQANTSNQTDNRTYPLPFDDATL